MDLKNEFLLTKNDTLVLKGIAICGMLCWHLFVATKPEETGVVFSSFTRFVGVIGDFCVSAFLFASGYGLTTQFAKIERDSCMLTNTNRGGANVKVSNL